MIKSVIFDMDGVLIDAREWHFEALNRALGVFGLGINRYDHLVTFDGLPTKKKLEMLSLEGKLPRGLHKVVNDLKQRFTMEIIVRSCKPVFQHQYALSRLRAEGYSLAVCSNSIRGTVDAMMNYADLNRFLEFYLSNEDVSKSKPDPEIYEKAIARLGVSPEEALILEDNENGIKAAEATGGHLLKVRDPQDVNYFNITKAIAAIDNA